MNKEFIDQLRDNSTETEWLEFKKSNHNPQLIGEYISALSNSACLHYKESSYLIYGIENKTHKIVGTSFHPHTTKGKGNEGLEPWLARMLSPKIDFEIIEFEYDEKRVVVFKIEPTENEPVKFMNVAYIRIGEHKHKLSDHPSKARKIWNKEDKTDWSAKIIKEAVLEHLDSDAILEARKQYKEKHKNSKFYDEIAVWDDTAFLNKARLTIEGKITNAAIILLGKEESVSFLSPSVAQITWILKDEYGIEKDYQHFKPPFLLKVDKLFSKIRNLTIRELPDGTLFPIEISQYDSWVMREALHNCIAHQDYKLNSRISIIENPTSLLFVNAGKFLPETIENVIRQDSPQGYYPNRLLTEAMVNLNMIDTIGSGIKRMFLTQRKNYLPMPNYDFSESDKVKVKLSGKIIDANYSKILIQNNDLDLGQIILLDKVQKKIKISKDAQKVLKKKKLVEGRYPSLYVSKNITATVQNKASYTKNKAFNKQYYKDLIIAYLKQHESAKPEEIRELIIDKLSDLLNEKQKRSKINNILYEMSRIDSTITNCGGRASNATWTIKE